MTLPSTDACLESETLVALLKDGADAATRARVEAHISRCDLCRKMLSVFVRTATPSPSTPRTGERFEAPVQFGRYVFAGELGAGGMGVVYAARDPELDRIVAVKLLRGESDPRRQDRLRREAQVMAKLAHPNVVAVYDVGVLEDGLFIAMEYVEGETLARWLAAPRSRREILDAYCAAGRGLAAAHAAGIVHRDFKPENVLVGKDGRVRVSDFGLARPTTLRAQLGGVFAEGTGVALAAGLTPALGDLTAPGTLMGTPRYMAPEVHGGKEADALSDQFSFCVGLFTALYGVPPFSGDRVDVLAANMRAGRLCEPRTARRIPRRIRAALRRGLAVEPSKRFGSLHELIAELSPRPHRGSWAIGLGAAMAAIAWLLARSPAVVTDQRCTGAPAAFETAWNPELRGAIATAFTANHAPSAAVVLRRVTSALDGYAARWAQAHTDACRATRILGEQTEAVLDLRMTCLERRRQGAAALIRMLAAADATAITRSLAALDSLGDIAACSDVAALRQVVAPPAERDRRETLAGLTQRLADARAKHELGAWTAALELTRGVVRDARALAYHPFTAEAEFLQGDIEYSLDDADSAERSLEAAVWSAEAGRHDEVAARGWVRLISVVGYRKADHARALAFAPRATAAIARLGGSADIESRLERALGLLEGSQGRLGAAIAHHERSVALAEQVDMDGSNTATSLEYLSAALLHQGHAERAVQIQKRAYEIREHLLGPDHADTAHTLAVLASAHDAAGHAIVAEEELRRALAIHEQTLGARHGDYIATLYHLATALGHQGRSAEAVELARRGAALGETAFGPEHPMLAGMLLALGVQLGRHGDHAQAGDALRRSEAILRKTYGPDHVQVMLVHIARAELLVRESRWREAVALYQRAIPSIEAAQLARNDVAWAIVHCARAFIALREPRRGLAPLERLAGKRDQLRPDTRVAVEFTLARALWDGGGDRARARELAVRALAEIEHVEGARDEDAAQMTRWLASRHRR